MFYLQSHTNSLVLKFQYSGDKKTTFLEGLAIPKKADNCLISLFYKVELVYVSCENADSLKLYQSLPAKNPISVS